MSTSFEDEKVAQLLRDSMAAHERAKVARKAKDPQSRAYLREARDLRVEAHFLDPDHLAPAWAAEDSKTPNGVNTHNSLLAFYDHQLRDEVA